jgi:hypothetical protein
MRITVKIAAKKNSNKPQNIHPPPLRRMPEFAGAYPLGQNGHFQHFYAYISGMAKPNHTIFVRIGLLYFLEIYQ